MSPREACKKKIHFDTRFEAELATARYWDERKEEMIVYRCGNHWHITHKYRRQRWSVRFSDTAYCGPCGCTVKRDNWQKHVLKPGHVAAKQRAKQT